MKKILTYTILFIFALAFSETMTFNINDYTISADYKKITYNEKTYSKMGLSETSVDVVHKEIAYSGNFFAEDAIINSSSSILIKPDLGFEYMDNDSSRYPEKPFYLGARGIKRQGGFTVFELQPFFTKNDSLFFVTSVSYQPIKVSKGSDAVKSQIYEKIDMVIITVPELEPNFERYRLFKARQGLQAVIKTTDKIYSEYPGENDVIKIRNFIKDKYIKNGLEFVLLGGGYGLIPVGKALPYSSSYTGYVATDMIYSNLDWDPDSNRNGIYFEGSDEPDYYPDVYVGRFPGNTKSEIDAIINKTVSYYSYPNSNNEGTAAEAFFAGFNVSGIGDGRNYCETIRTELNTFFVADTLYESVAPSFTAQNILQRLDKGHNLVYIQAHGDDHAIRQKDNQFKIWSDQVNLTTGISGLYFIGSCNPGNIASDSFSRKAMISPNGGCVNYIGSSGSEFPSSSIKMNAWFFKGLMSGKTLGRSLAESSHIYGNMKQIGYGKYLNMAYNLQGDPSNRPFIKSPSDLDILSIGGIKRGKSEVSVTFDKVPGDTVYVSLVSSNKLIAAAKTTVQNFTIQYEGIASDSVFLSYHSQKNLLRTAGYLTLPADEVAFDIDSVSVIDSNSSGVIEDGESFGLLMKLKLHSNPAGIDSLVAMVVSCDHNEMAIINGQKRFKLPLPGKSVSLSGFSLKFSSADYYMRDSVATADFEIRKKNGTKLYSKKIKIPVSVPYLKLHSFKSSQTEINASLYNVSGGKIDNAKITLVEILGRDGEVSGDEYAEKSELSLNNIAGYKVISDGIVFQANPSKKYRLSVLINNKKRYYTDELLYASMPDSSLNLFADYSAAGMINLEWTHQITGTGLSYNIYTSNQSSFSTKQIQNYRPVYLRNFSFGHSSQEPVFIKVALVDSMGREFKESGVVKVEPMPLYKGQITKCYPFQMYNPVFFENKLISNTITSSISALNADGTLVNGTGIIHQADLNGFSSSEPQGFAIGDITGSGNSEMVNFSYSMGDSVLVKLICLETGAIRAQRRIYGYVLETVPVLSDIDSDNLPEVFVSVINGNIGGTAAKGAYIYGLKYNSGRLDMLSGYPIYSNADSFNVHSPSVLDLDGNGSKELIVDVGKKILVYNAVTAAKITEFTLPKNSQTSLSFCDLEENGSIEIFALTDSYGTYGKLFSFNFNGTSLTERAATSGGLNLDMKTWNLYDISPPVSFADFNNDGVTEIVVLTASRLYLYNRDFTPYPNFPVSLDPRVVRNNSSAPAFADLNGDGHLDILFYDANYRVWCYSGSSGALLNGFPIKIENINRFEMTAPAVADLDNDGDLEFAIGVRDGYIVIYDYPSLTSDRAVSDKFRGDLYNSGLYQPLIPSAPQGVSISAFGSQITLSWNSVHNAVRYTVYSCDSPYGTFVYEGQTTGTSLVIYPGTAAKRFYYIKAER
jgi:hypothetical protein